MDYLGDAAWYLDLVVDRRDGGAELLKGAHRLVLPINWKFGAENFGGDNHHVPISHGSTRVARPAAQQARPQVINGDPYRANVYAGNGHCVIGGFTGPEQSTTFLSSSPDAAEYFQHTLGELHQRLGPERGRQGSMGIATIFPNFTWFSLSGCMVRVWHPRASTRTEAWTYCIVDNKAPDVVREGIRRRLTLCFSPSGLFEQDDMDNFGQSTLSGNSQIGREFPINMQMGLGKDRSHESIPGVLSPGVSENNARYFYARWAEVMEAPSWSHIHLDPRTRS